MLSLNLQRVSFGYDHRAVVQDVTFQVRQGEMVGIIGPNGAGKSTLIKGISRIIRIISGRILLGSREISEFGRLELARMIAVVPQNPSLPETFTAHEVVMMGRTPHLGLLRYEGIKDFEVVRQAMENTDTLKLADRRISELSGGERQRLTIARALAQEPKLLLLDEPTAHLDINYQVEILNLIRRLCYEDALITIIALHDLNIAAQYCSRLVMLSNGRVFCEGTPHEVINPQNIKRVYGAEVYVCPHPVNDLPMTLIMSDRRNL
jgi:iron complex transport system ATP-binding protein